MGGHYLPPMPQPDAHSETRRRTMRELMLAAFVLVPLGVLVVGWAHHLGRQASPWAAPLFWAGLTTIFAPAAVLIWRERLSRGETLLLLLAVGLGLFAANALRSPGMLTDFDELLHLRTLDDIVRTGRLFSPNPLLRISPSYPGLELLTHCVMSATGIGEVQAALLAAASARTLLIVSVFLLLERVAVPTRLTGLGTLLYMTAPSFFAFDAAFAYETLALPLAVFCLYALRAAQHETGRTRAMLNVAGAAAALAVVVTHHVTSFILAGALVGWTAITLLTRKRPLEPLPGGGWVPVVTLTAVLAWMTGVATATVDYLAPHATASYAEATRILSGQGLGRRLFEAPGSVSAAPLERVVAIAAVILIVACLPLGVLYFRRYQRGQMLPRFLLLSTLAYPAVMGLRFTVSGWEIGSRAMAFLYVPLAYVLVSGTAWLRERVGRRMWAAPAMAAALTVVFLGGIIAGTSPVNRLARPYDPGAYDASIEGEDIAAAQWARETLPFGGRVAADSTNGSLLGSIGRQYALSSLDDVSLSGLFLLPFGDYQRHMIAERHVDYAVVDRRIAEVVPPSGFFYEKWEREVADYGKTIDPMTLSRFDELTGVDRIFDSGSIQIYDLRGLRR